MRKSRLFWLGLFIAGGLALIVWGIFFLGKKEKIFEQTFYLYVPFENVVGLRAGTAVRLSGIDIGVVDRIRLPEAPGSKVIVALRLDKDAKHLIRKDAQAVIETEGLVGSKVVSIKGSTFTAPHVAEGDTISSRSPIDLNAILDTFDETSRYMQFVTQSLEGITSQIGAGKGTIGKLVYDEEFYNKLLSMTRRSDSISAAVFKETGRLSHIITQVSTSTDSLIKRVREGKGTLGALIYKEDLHDYAMASISSVRDSLQGLIGEMRHGEGLIGRAVSDEALAAQLDSSLYRLARLNDELTDISKIARAGALGFAENMEALKHNWLFKGYFERSAFGTAPSLKNIMHSASKNSATTRPGCKRRTRTCRRKSSRCNKSGSFSINACSRWRKWKMYRSRKIHKIDLKTKILARIKKTGPANPNAALPDPNIRLARISRQFTDKSPAL